MKWTEVGEKLTFPEFGIDKFRDFPKSGSYRLAVADHPRLSLRGKTENKIDAQMKIWIRIQKQTFI